ncbi:MAG: S1 RNA-binding domain-containing protein [Candidatus Portnoybacteria bacterium]
MIDKKQSKMKDLLAKEKDSLSLPQPGDLIEGIIIKMSKNEIIVDLGVSGTGIIYGGELKENKALIKGLKVGQEISALIVTPENEDGHTELSLKEANLKQVWSDLKESREGSKNIAVRVIEANRGGLVVEFSGIVGFLPVSQLSPQNYPRVEGGDKNKILKHLNGFVGQEILVKVITLDRKNEKLIVSEKAAQEKEIRQNLEKHKEGEVVDGVVTALTDFGAFIKFGDNLEGLAHISELDWQMINHPSQVVAEKEKVKAQIISISGGQITLSLKALKDDPWQGIEKKYQPGQIVEGKVTKISPSGAFIEIDGGIHGLVHSSEFSQQENSLDLGQLCQFKILSLVPGKHKMALKTLTQNDEAEQK